MQSSEDASEPSLPLSNSGVIKATAPAAAAYHRNSGVAEEDIPPLPPPGVPSLNDSLNSDAPTQSQSSTSKKSGKRSTNRKHSSNSGIHKNVSINDQKEGFDLEIASHHSGLSRPSSRASHASEFSGLGQEDFMAKYKMMKLLLKEKEKELQKMQEAQGQENPSSPHVLAKVFGKKTDAEKEEEQALVQPVDPAEILKKVRRRRCVVLVMIFAGMCILPFMLLPVFKNELTP